MAKAETTWRLASDGYDVVPADPKAAKELSGTPERSAWTMVGNVLLNMDETITKE